MHLSKSINVSMAMAGINQQQLAGKLEVSAATVSSIIRRGTCHSDTIAKLARVFGIPSSEFIARGEAQ